MTEELRIVDADTLLSTPIKKTRYIIEGFLPEGISILCGAPKVGKSWLMLWICLQVSQGLPVWSMKTQKCDVLYLCLEDPLHRIQDRLYSISESAPDNLYFANTSSKLDNGFQKQIHTHMQNHPETKLIVIDTLQKIRNTYGHTSMLYAADYNDITALKVIADKYGIAILAVHHLRKMLDSNDPFNQVSGTTGITGAVDSIFVITKDSRTDETAFLTASGRDIEQQQLTLRFQDRVWHLIDRKGQAELKEEAIPMFIHRVVRFAQNRKEWSGTASQLLSLLGDTETSPIIVTKLLSRYYYDALQPKGIIYVTKRTSKERLIYLTTNDSYDSNDNNTDTI